MTAVLKLDEREKQKASIPEISSYNSSAVVLLQLAIMGRSLERVRRAYRRPNDGVMFGRGHGHACASTQFASR